MKFNSLEEMIRYIVTEGVDIKSYNISLDDVVSDNTKEAVSEEKEAVNVKINSFFDMPLIEAAIGDDNVLYVDSFEALKDSCGTGKISVLGRDMVTNLCEMDGEAHIMLSVDFLDKTNYNVDFKIKLISEQDGISTIQLKDTLLHGTQIST